MKQQISEELKQQLELKAEQESKKFRFGSPDQKLFWQQGYYNGLVAEWESHQEEIDMIKSCDPRLDTHEAALENIWCKFIRNWKPGERNSALGNILHERYTELIPIIIKWAVDNNVRPLVGLWQINGHNIGYTDHGIAQKFFDAFGIKDTDIIIEEE